MKNPLSAFRTFFDDHVTSNCAILLLLMPALLQVLPYIFKEH
jgi:hypothetical protein